MELEFISDDEMVILNASGYKAAYNKYNKLLAICSVESCKLLVNVKSSYTALLFAATHIAKKAADKACSTATQAAILAHCEKIYHSVINSIIASDMDDTCTAAAISELIYSADNDADAKEYISIAQDALTESVIKNMTVSDCILAAYRAVNTHINKLRTASEKERTQEYITAQGGELIAIDDLTARIIGTSKKQYIPSMPPSTVPAPSRTEELGIIIKHIISTYLTPVQREIMLLLVKNCYTLQEMADIRDCTKSTIYKHIVNIRYIMTTYLQDNNIDIIKAHNIDVAAVESDYIRYNNYKRNYDKAIADTKVDKELEKKKLNNFVNNEYRQNKKRTNNNKK